MVRTLQLDAIDATGDRLPLAPASLAKLEREFPSVRVEAASASAAWIDAHRWSDPDADLFAFDEQIFGHVDRGGEALGIRGTWPELQHVPVEVLSRYQCLIGRRNTPARSARFEAVLARHRSLHDLSKPLVRADFAHALDAWQWVLRLAPAASFELQVAALFHDVERLASESDVRIEQHAPDYQAFKEAHARGGAALVHAALGNVVEDRELHRIAALVAKHERPGSDEALALLNDADALSWFSLNAYGFLSYFGPQHTRRKVAYTIARLRPHQRWRLAELRLPGTVRAMLDEELGGAAPLQQEGSA